MLRSAKEADRGRVERSAEGESDAAACRDPQKIWVEK